MRKPGPTGFPFVPPLSVPWTGETPYELTFSRALLWERILRGLEARQAIKEIVSNQQLQIGHTLGLGTLGPGYGSQWQPPAAGFPALDGMLGMPQTDRQIKAVMALYSEYEDLVRNDWNKLEKGIRRVLTAEAVEQIGKKSSSLESLKHALRMANEAQRSEYESRLGRLYYQWLRPYYYVAGIVDPPKELNKIRTDFKFLGKDIGGAHPELVQILSKTEKILDDMGRKQEVADGTKRRWAFNPRPKNDFSGLSNHALGRALDIDPETNPHIKGSDAKLVDEVLAHLKIPAGFAKPFQIKDLSLLPEAEAAILFGQMAIISNVLQDFLQKHLAAWETLAQQREGFDKKLKHWDRNPKSRPSDSEIAAVKVLRDGVNGLLQADPNIHVGKLVEGLGGIKKARIARDKGLMTISGLLFIAFKKAGAVLKLHDRSGLEYKTAKDTMHFEVLGDERPSGRLQRSRVSFVVWFANNSAYEEN